MRLNVSAIDGNFRRRARQCGCQFGEQILPDALLRPAVIAVVDRHVGAVLRRAVTPAAPRLQHMNDAADDAAVILTPTTRRSVRQMRFNQSPLIVRQPELTVHTQEPPSLSS